MNPCPDQLFRIWACQLCDWPRVQFSSSSQLPPCCHRCWDAPIWSFKDIVHDHRHITDGVPTNPTMDSPVFGSHEIPNCQLLLRNPPVTSCIWFIYDDFNDDFPIEHQKSRALQADCSEISLDGVSDFARASWMLLHDLDGKVKMTITNVFWVGESMDNPYISIYHHACPMLVPWSRCGFSQPSPRLACS